MLLAAFCVESVVCVLSVTALGQARHKNCKDQIPFSQVAGLVQVYLSWLANPYAGLENVISK